jgi:hypothetical protein
MILQNQTLVDEVERRIGKDDVVGKERSSGGCAASRETADPY